MTSYPTAVLIVNFRTPVLSVQAVVSTLADPDVSEVIVVENGSGDGSAELLAAALPTDPRITLVTSPTNLGFGRANNLGAEQATSPFLFLLNSDAELRSGGIGKLAAALEGEHPCSIVAPEVRTSPRDELQIDAAGRFPSAANVITGRVSRPSNPSSPDWVSGCAMLLRRDSFRDLGGFDPGFFMYLEDVHLCWKARQAGGTIRIERSVKVTHLGGASYRSAVRTPKPEYARSHDLYLQKTGASYATRTLVRSIRAARDSVHRSGTRLAPQQ